VKAFVEKRFALVTPAAFALILGGFALVRLM